MDALVGLLFVLAVETGFTPLAAEDRLRVAAPAHCGPSVPSLRAISRMPRAWRQRRPAGPHYLVDFALGTTAEAAVRLAGVVCGGVLIANMLTADATFSIGLVAEDYVGRGGALHKLGPLSRAFKDAVAVPARAAVLNARCVCNASLLGLPVDLQLLLARTLAAGELRDLLHLGLTCRCLAAVLDDPVTWRLVARRHHPTLYKQLEGQEQVDWKDRVRREREKLASAARRQRRRSPPPTPPPPPQPPPPPFRPFLPFPPPRPMPRPWYPDDDDLFL
ncbi:hypothetical protein ONE63_005292 [Megalurothrips usitatus]|uniref:F-box domain-containing protein n=1 Tax=Megalurothrips usitatus TaxID=439358 RepID=A0AAV7Y172_9NEOP|nr:hypothetical protein ONE63_005292 [Megalurothrips usitatus]